MQGDECPLGRGRKLMGGRIWGGVHSSPHSGAMGNNSDFEIIMAVGKRLYRSVF